MNNMIQNEKLYQMSYVERKIWPVVQNSWGVWIFIPPIIIPIVIYEHFQYSILSFCIIVYILVLLIKCPNMIF